MNAIKIHLAVCLAIYCILGCANISERSVPATGNEPQCMAKPPQPTPTRQSREWNDKQLNLLRSFAIAESPKLWQTVQVLRAEHETRAAALVKLRTELIDFGRNPDADLDYVSLRVSNDSLLESLNLVYAKIEDAYIAYKKCQATPGRKEYADMMKLALEDGIQEADSAVAKFRTMSKEK